MLLPSKPCPFPSLSFPIFISTSFPLHPILDGAGILIGCLAYKPPSHIWGNCYFTTDEGVCLLPLMEIRRHQSPSCIHGYWRIRPNLPEDLKLEVGKFRICASGGTDMHCTVRVLWCYLTCVPWSLVKYSVYSETFKVPSSELLF